MKKVLGSARDAVTHTRFAVRRDDGGSYPALLDELSAAADDLATLEEQLK